MRAFVAGCAAAIVIAVGAYFVLGALGMSAGQEYSTPNVRLDS